MELIKEIINYGGAGALLILVMGLCVEIAPVKINPIQWVGGRLNADIKSEICDVKNDVVSLKHEIGESKADDVRYRILRFDDEIRHKEKHSEEHFNQIIDDVNWYKQYCIKHPQYENSKAVLAIRNIIDTYAECRKNNSFLI